ncbi:Z1 domain-containing protein [Flavobacterium sp. PL02]|uniref:Z1 domain-containing protein n=1 Tax=Flavobacterium sp. PL02 TaxID=3088354 RepID=UPI002B23A4E7|nr:Z1 domain-containing protein [Flavobacterium sp. PL02]MEA9412661.1 Z1 domain-containing protein [Flavobacterium sp. PL02]
MEQRIEIIENKNTTSTIVVGEQTNQLIGRFSQLDSEEIDTLLSETAGILSNCVPPNVDGSETGIAIGYVQSGKTMSFTTLSAMAYDNGYSVIIYLAGVKNNLLSQTNNRLKKDLLTGSTNSRIYKVYDNPKIQDDAIRNISKNLQLSKKPAILITVLKHQLHIKELAEIFSHYDVKTALGNKGVLIIDDEADQASLNNAARKNSKLQDWEDKDFSSTYSNILNLRAAFDNHSYIQYTATPQGPLLINILDLLSPNFHTILTPGKTYTGGKTFFRDNPSLINLIPQEEVYHGKINPLDDCPQSLINAIQVYLIGVAIVVNIQNKETMLSMMIHADKERDASKKFKGWVINLIEQWEEILRLSKNDPTRKELIDEFKKNYLEATKLLDSAPKFEEVIEEVLEVILDTKIHLVIAGNAGIDWDNATSHILIGADMLNRGFTIEGLSVSYMPRNTKNKSNADTIQQRARFFGYKNNYLKNCRVYLPQGSIDEFDYYIEHEEIMRENLKKMTLEQYAQTVILDESMNPTRNNILSIDIIRNKMAGWKQFNTIQHAVENIDFVERFISSLNLQLFYDYGSTDRNHLYCDISIDDAIGFLKKYKASNIPDTLRKSSTIQYLKYVKDTKAIDKVYIFQMAYQVITGRQRSLKNERDRYVIKQIFSGSSGKTSGNYPGDRSIKREDALCIQIHKISVKDNPDPQKISPLFYTLAVYYPNEISHSFVGMPNTFEEND